MAFLRTSESLSGSAPGKSLMDPRKPLWENNTGLLGPHIRRHHANTLSGYFHGSLSQVIRTYGKHKGKVCLMSFSNSFSFHCDIYTYVSFFSCLIILLCFFCASLFLQKDLDKQNSPCDLEPGVWAFPVKVIRFVQIPLYLASINQPSLNDIQLLSPPWTSTLTPSNGCLRSSQALPAWLLLLRNPAWTGWATGLWGTRAFGRGLPRSRAWTGCWEPAPRRTRAWAARAGRGSPAAAAAAAWAHLAASTGHTPDG